MNAPVNYTDILDFWFKDIDSSLWFRKDATFDQLLKDRYSLVHQQAARGDFAPWRGTGLGRLAEIIVLDQFSRNMFRETPEAFAYDPMALQLAQEAVAYGMDRELRLIQKSFLYMPFMHSENKDVHAHAVKLFSQPGLEGNLRFEIEHKAIIDRFGRYPHRNHILGRTSTPEEIEFLKEPNSAF